MRKICGYSLRLKLCIHEKTCTNLQETAHRCVKKHVWYKNCTFTENTQLCGRSQKWSEIKVVNLLENIKKIARKYSNVHWD